MYRWIISVLLLKIILFGNSTTSYLAYRRNNCDVSISSVIKELFHNEIQAFFNPHTRSVNSQHIRYDLYTSLNPYEGQILHTGDVEALKKSNFNPNWPIRFSIHGWFGKSTTCSNAAIKDAYLEKGNFNIIIVDWSIIAYDISYPRISQQLSDIANQIVKFIRFLQRETKLNTNNIYMIGHSAGAHISGLTGKLLKPQRLGAIIALDPAGLVQLGLPPEVRLAANDALYTESIHTDTSFLGNPNLDLSHASFFPNWGLAQTHCPNTTAAEFDFACDHFAALYYFVESVQNSKAFGALKLINHSCLLTYNCTCRFPFKEQTTCASDAYMGGEPVIPKRGVYYLSTRHNHPFGIGNVVQIRKARKPNYETGFRKPFSLRSLYSRKNSRVTRLF